jgi:hypothetical protein
VAELKDFDEILSNCLEALESGEGLADVLARYPQAADELKPLLEAEVWLKEQKAAVEPRPGFVRASRSRLLEKIEAEPVVTGGWLERTWTQLTRAVGSGWRVALEIAVAAVLLACLVLSGSGVALASQEALPGDTLYPVKVSLERVELLVTPGTAEKITLHNQFAQARLVEVQELVMEGRFNYIRETVSNFEAHVTQAAQLLTVLARRDPENAKKLAVSMKETLASQRSFLSFLMTVVPPEVTPEISRALGIVADGEGAVKVVQDQAGNTPTITATPTLLAVAGEDITATVAEQRSSDSPTPTPLASSSMPDTATPTAPISSPTSTSTMVFTPTRTLAPTRTATPAPKREEPAPTYTRRPPTEPPPPTNPPDEPTQEPKKTRRPPPNPTRRPPRSTRLPRP